MTRSIAFVLAASVATAGCAHYSKPEKATSQLAFGTEVARKGLWREASFRFEQAVAASRRTLAPTTTSPLHSRRAANMRARSRNTRSALELDAKDQYIRRNYARFAEFYTSYTRTTGKTASGS